MIFGAAGVACSSRRVKRETASVYVALPAAGIRPSAPIFVTLTGTTPGQKSVTWEGPETLVGGDSITSDPVTSYKVYWRSSAIPFDLSAYDGSATVSAPTLNHTITGLTPSAALFVCVTAINSAGEGNPSPQDESTVP